MAETGRLVCRGCGRVFPVISGVAVMVSDTQVQRAPMMPLSAAQHMLAGTAAAGDGVSVLRLRQASGVQAGKVQAAPQQAEGSACRMVWELLPRRLPPGAEVVAHLRLTNPGNAALRSNGPGQAMFAVTWADSAGGQIEASDLRTPFSADLEPSQSATHRIRILAPVQAGQYIATISVVEDSVRWITPPLGRICMDVTEQTHGVAADPVTEAEGAGHAAVAALLRRWLPPRATLLQFGDAGPWLAGSDCTGVTVGDNLAHLQMASLLARHRGSTPCLVQADLTSIPFPPAFFDAAVVAAPVGNWDNPVGVLRRARSHLRPGGCLALVDQACGDTGDGALNEAEYRTLFRLAHLRAAELVVAAGRLAARLVPEEAGDG